MNTKVLMFAAALMALAVPAAASTYTLTATSNQYGMGDFQMTLDDADDDLIFTLGDVLDLTPFTIWHDWNIVGITGTPDMKLAGVHELDSRKNYSEYNWSFLDDKGRTATVGQNAWTYSVSGVAAAVPVPAAAFLMLGGLGALGALRASRKRTA